MQGKTLIIQNILQKKHSMVMEGDHCFREKYSLYFSGFIEGGDKKSYVAEGV